MNRVTVSADCPQAWQYFPRNGVPQFAQCDPTGRALCAWGVCGPCMQRINEFCTAESKRDLSLFLREAGFLRCIKAFDCAP